MTGWFRYNIDNNCGKSTLEVFHTYNTFLLTCHAVLCSVKRSESAFFSIILMSMLYWGAESTWRYSISCPAYRISSLSPFSRRIPDFVYPPRVSDVAYTHTDRSQTIPPISVVLTDWNDKQINPERKQDTWHEPEPFRGFR